MNMNIKPEICKLSISFTDNTSITTPIKNDVFEIIAFLSGTSEKEKTIKYFTLRQKYIEQTYYIGKILNTDKDGNYYIETNDKNECWVPKEIKPEFVLPNIYALLENSTIQNTK